MITAMSASSSSSSATVAVEKATSDLLIGPDWTMNIDICDSVNSHHWQAKDVVKAVKRRLQHKSPKVQLLALTLLETMVKNCGDYLHFQIAEKNILGEMVKIVKKKTDMHVRDKILVLLDSWQEAFGGPGGKYPQYYWAYEELRRAGVQFPQRSIDSSPIFTPPVTHPTLRNAQAGYGMPISSSRRLDETMATDEGVSLSSLDSMRNVLELLNDMLQAVNPRDREAVKDEIIVDLVNQCRSNQKTLMQMLTTTGDEELLGKGLELNDSLQILLAKHDAIATGTPIPTQVASLDLKLNDGSLPNAKTAEVQGSSSKANSHPTAPAANITKHQIDEEDEEDDFAQLARRHSKAETSPSQSTSGTSGALVQAEASSRASSTASSSNPNACTELALPDPPAPVRTTKEQDMIDLLSLALTTVSTSPRTHTPHAPHTPPHPNQTIPHMPVSGKPGYPYGSQTYSGGQQQVPYSSYVVPWAQPQPQNHIQASPQPPLQTQLQNHLQSPSKPPLQSQPEQHFQSPSEASSQHQPQQHIQPSLQPQAQQYYQHPQQPTFQAQSQQHIQSSSQSSRQPETQHHFQPTPQHHQQSQSQHQSLAQSQQQFQPQTSQQLNPQIQPQLQSRPPPQYSPAYIPPPWAATPGYANGHHHMSATSFSNSEASTPGIYTTQAARPMQHYNSFTARGNNGLAMNGDPLASPAGPRNPPASGGQKPFIPSYRLFEDLNVLGNADGKFRMTGSQSASLSGNSGQRMIGMRK